MTDYITILTCMAPEAMATKVFTVLDDGTVNKKSYSAGMLFGYEERAVSSLHDIHNLLRDLQTEPQKFIIRGKPKDDIVAPVKRRIHSAEAAFLPHPRHWVMLDMDKIIYPNEMDVVGHPAQVIEWVKSKLPAPFNNTQCVYKFSSSQNVPVPLGDNPQKIVSAHLYYWCDKPVSENEWKRFFQAHGTPIDYSIFNPVQPHFTANPLFYGLADPMPERVGLC